MSALNVADHNPDLFEVFCHPHTAAELEHHTAAGILKVNGLKASAQIVDRLGNGDVTVRIIVDPEPMRLVLVA